MNFYTTLIIFLSFIILTSCNDIEYQCGPDDLTQSIVLYEDVYERVFEPKCVGCHSGSFAQEGFDMSREVGYENMVNVNSRQRTSEILVVPGDPENSYFFRKITGENIDKTRMPQGTPLSESEIELVRKWILDGAIKR